jgi:hypothetical protein
MHMMLRVTMPTDKGNAVIEDGSLAKLIENTMKQTQAEAAYFTTMNGKRSALFFFDMKDASEIPAIAEPLFVAFHAEIELSPVMNVAELQKGLAGLMASKSLVV